MWLNASSTASTTIESASGILVTLPIFLGKLPSAATKDINSSPIANISSASVPVTIKSTGDVDIA